MFRGHINFPGRMKMYRCGMKPGKNAGTWHRPRGYDKINKPGRGRGRGQRGRRSEKNWRTERRENQLRLISKMYETRAVGYYNAAYIFTDPLPRSAYKFPALSNRELASNLTSRSSRNFKNSSLRFGNV